MPLVTVIVPCYNEEATIELLLEAIYQQDFPHQELEVIIADGISIDRTRQKITEFSKRYPDLTIKIIDNPQRIIPAALNRAIQAAHGKFILRLDAHSIPYPNYITNSIRALEAGKGDNVGGIWEIRPGGVGGKPPGIIARGIAAAAAYPLGVGDAYYRLASQAKAVDTVPFGAFHKELLDKIGGFDETLLTNEDYELNLRIRQSGGKIWLDPSIRSVYLSRTSLGQLAHQYWRYGFWKGRMLIRYPTSLRWRQALPPIFIVCLVLLGIFSIWLPIIRWLLGLQIALYLCILSAAGIHISQKKGDPALLVALPLAIITMHMTWGSGLLWSLGKTSFSPHKMESLSKMKEE